MNKKLIPLIFVTLLLVIAINPISYADEMPELSSNATGANWELGVDLEGLIDVEAELKKNRTQREKLLGFIAGKEKKLSNEAFTAKAPAKVVDAERASLADLKAQLAAVEEAIARLER